MCSEYVSLLVILDRIDPIEDSDLTFIVSFKVRLGYQTLRTIRTRSFANSVHNKLLPRGIKCATF